MQIYDFKIEYRKNPVGIDAKKPRFSWKIQSSKENTMQDSYRLVVKKGEKKVWDSGVVKNEECIGIRYQGEKLESQSVYAVSLEVTDNHGKTARAQEYFETAFMTAAEIEAEWITHGFEEELEPCAVFKKEFQVRGKVVSARLYASALGIYEFTLNEKAVSDVCFAPGWTSYQSQIQYQTYDITEAVEQNNVIEFTVGNGWYKGILGFFNQGNHYGNRTALLAQIELVYEDGIRDVIITDEGWTSTTGVHRYSELYHGEVIDYTTPKQEERPVSLMEQSRELLLAQQNEPVRITERLAAKELLITPKGEVVIDFGQNINGVIEACIKADRGTKVVLRHAESLDENNNFYTTNLRTAKATDTFICSGAEDTFRPKFTSHGFRYIAVEGLGEDIDISQFTACVIHTDLAKTGDFECSNPLVNRLYQNIDWSLRDNFMDIPTDCPQRDERLGYTGDAQIFLPTAAWCRNVELFFEKWLRDLTYEQSLGDGIPTTVPNILGPGGGIAIWHDAGTIIPWTLYENYGDKSVLEKQFDSMVSCVEYSRGMAGEEGLIKSGQQLGDWVSIDVPRGPMLKRTEEIWNLELIEKMGATDPYYIANVYFLHSISLVVKAAKELGREVEREQYEALYEEVLGKIRDEYITKNGRLISETQTGCAMALHFNIVEEKDREKTLDTLISNVKQHKNHLTTGFAGTPFLCPVLSENGAHDVAGSIFLKEDCPSWLYSVKLGGTTMWELWDGVNPDGSFNKFEMNSLNHYSYGSIGSWILHDLLGIKSAAPGYKKSQISPRLIKGIPDMKGYIETAYGRITCDIRCLDHKYIIDIEIPANTTAVVSLPEREAEELGSGSYHFEYETESSFIKERYNVDTKFGELLDHPVGYELLNQYAKDLVGNEMFLMFAKEQPVMEVLGMLPAEVVPLIDMVIAQCNANPASEGGE
ncbi:alpha-L-rhamnosidase [Robinsoniella peoriensis]|uniref:alpha-L-rhamnosidase n=1 Tax=Robinsoniella peoriensis TaxID=180332 RepID=UPI0005C7D970|nr:alpha-L-rhamnosidase [Robinsoniella peoriensis]